MRFKKSKKQLVLLLYIFIFVLVFSNFKIFGSNNIRKFSLYSTFFILLIYFILKSKGSWSKNIIFILLTALFTIFYLFCRGYGLNDDRFIYLILDSGMLIIGYGITNLNIRGLIDKLLKFYVLMCLFAGIYYLMNYDINIVYGFGLKHSLGYNFVIAMAIIVFYKRKIFKPRIRVTLFGILSFVIINLNSRSTIIGILGMITFYIVKDFKIMEFKKKHKYLFNLIIYIFPLIFYGIYKFYSIIFYALRLDTLKSMSLDRYSADRVGMINLGLSEFAKSPIFGISGMGIRSDSFYVENFFIDILVQLGLIGFLLFMTYIFGSYIAIIRKKKRSDLQKLALYGFFGLLICGFFSANVPMGPGTVCSMLWIIIGAALGPNKSIMKKTYN